MPFVIKLFALERKKMDVVFLGLNKVFRRVLCSILVAKMGRYRLEYIQVAYKLDEKLAGLIGSKDSGQ